MPKGKKPSKDFHGKKGKSGRRKFSEEVFLKAKELYKEDLAKELHNTKLMIMKKEGFTDDELKDFVMPVVVKGMTEKIDHTTKGEKIIGINYVTPDGNNDKANV